MDVYLQGWGTKVIETDESRRDTLHEGWAKAVVSCSSTPCEDIVMFGIFATVPAPGNPAYEATVFASDSRSNMAMVPFDNRDGFTTGIAVAAHNCTASDPDVRIDFKYADEPGSTFYQFQVPMKCPGAHLLLPFGLQREVSEQDGLCAGVLQPRVGGGARPAIQS